MRETVEVSLFPAELPKKVILSVKNAENLEHLREKLKTGKMEGAYVKNILHIDAASGLCDLMSNLNDGTNQVVLDIHADTALHPTLEIAGSSIGIDQTNFSYAIPSADYVGSGILQFRVVDNEKTGEYFQVSKVASDDGNLILKQTSAYVYALSLARTGESAATTVSVKVGGTTTLPAGSAANVYNSGDEQDVVLQFAIPQGATGARGPQGPQGERGPIGPQGPAGTDYAIRPGDTMTITRMYCAGGVTGSGTNLYFYVPLARPLVGVTGATITNPSTAIITGRKTEGGYIAQDATVNSLGTPSCVPYENGVTVAIKAASAYNTKNNTPVVVTPENLTLEFT